MDSFQCQATSIESQRVMSFRRRPESTERLNRSSFWTPDYAGVRPKLAAPGEPFRDFVVAEESAAGFPGLGNCIGIESPGLTAAAAIASRVAAVLASL